MTTFSTSSFGETVRRLHVGRKKNGGEPAWPWMPRAWRKNQSVHLSCGSSIIMGKTRGGIG
jgi:hypothetical protein